MPQSLDNLSTNWTSTATLTGIKFNVATDTGPSNAASNLMDLQVGGASRFTVGKTLTNGIVYGGVTFRDEGSGQLSINRVLYLGADSLSNTRPYSWAGTFAAPDLYLARDAANTLAQRNGTNAQTFRVYNTFTDASNYERVSMRWNGNVFEIGTEFAGSGVARGIFINVSTEIRIGGAGGSTIYFTPGNTPGFRMDASANFYPSSNNTLSVGRSTNRVANYYVGTTVDFGEAANIVAGTTTGTKIGTATTQKLGFYNATPVVQPTAVADATDAATVITQLNALLSRMRDLGLIAA